MRQLPWRCLAIRFLIPLSWRNRRDRIARSLNRFSEVEADSAWQMLQALERVDDEHFRVELFNNALEEVHHAAVFRRLARSYQDELTAQTSEERCQLFDASKGLIHFEAHHFVGEADVYRQFLSYAHAAGHDDIRETFMEIRGDEEEHQRLAHEQLVEMCGSDRGARRLIRRVRLGRAYESWMRSSKGLSTMVSSAVLQLIYWLFAPVLAPACRRRLCAAAPSEGNGTERISRGSESWSPDEAESGNALCIDGNATHAGETY